MGIEGLKNGPNTLITVLHDGQERCDSFEAKKKKTNLIYNISYSHGSIFGWRETPCYSGTPRENPTSHPRKCMLSSYINLLYFLYSDIFHSCIAKGMLILFFSMESIAVNHLL